MKRIVFVALFIFSVSAASAQNYHTGIGVRLGGLTSGITVKHFVNPSSALEGILGFGYRAFLITGLYEKHQAIPSAAGLDWFYGAGAHIGFFRYGGYYRVYGNKHMYVENYGENAAVVGIDFIIGLEYKFNNVPLTVGLDLKPFVDFYSGASGYFDGALTFRFAF